MAQVLTLVAFLLDSPLLRPIAWATGAIAIYAIWDYYRVAPPSPAEEWGTRWQETKRVSPDLAGGAGVHRAARRAVRSSAIDGDNAAGPGRC